MKCADWLMEILNHPVTRLMKGDEPSSLPASFHVPPWTLSELRLGGKPALMWQEVLFPLVDFPPERLAFEK